MVKKFIEYLQYEKKYSDHTVLSYQTDIRQFCLFLEVDLAHFDPVAVTLSEINKWFVAMVRSGISTRTICRKASTLKSFWKYLLSNGLVSENPTKKMILPKSKKELPTFYKESVVDTFLEKEKNKKDFVSVRNRLIISLFYQTGVRVSELVQMKNTDVDFYANQITVIGKRNKARKLPIGVSLKAEIEHYVDLRNNEMEQQSIFLFVRKNGLPMYSKAVYNVVHESMSSLTTLRKQSPHVLRHTFATTMLNHGADIYAVKELLGHSSLAATQVYTHVSFAELNKIYKQAHPRAKKD